ncbi:unnamed protein product, partial [Ixodes hexagonus]
MIWALLTLPCTVVATIKRLVTQTFFIAVVFSVITWSSVLLYGMFYWSYIPKSSHHFPVHLHFESRSCPEGFCDYPVANVTVVRPGYGEYLARGQRYKIYLDLEMPESDANQKIGMFTVKIDMITETGEVVRSSLRSGVLRYKSAIVRLLSTLTYIPMLMFGSAEEKQTVSVLLFDRYEEDYERPAIQASIVIRNKFIEVYTATLRIYADFTGLRYLLYNWPLSSALVGISTNFFFVALVALLSWNRLAPARPRRQRRPSRRPSVSSGSRTEDDSGQCDVNTVSSLS